jgi:hypothetical protein
MEMALGKDEMKWRGRMVHVSKTPNSELRQAEVWPLTTFSAFGQFT